MFPIQQHLLKIAFKSEWIIHGTTISLHSFVSQKGMFLSFDSNKIPIRFRKMGPFSQKEMFLKWLFPLICFIYWRYSRLISSQINLSLVKKAFFFAYKIYLLIWSPFSQKGIFLFALFLVSRLVSTLYLINHIIW